MKAFSAILLVSLLLGPVPARAASAPPPIGLWNGAAVNMPAYKIRLLLSANGTYVYYEGPQIKLTGRWGWQSSSPVGGILTLHYVTPTVTQTFQNNLYIILTYLSATKLQERVPPSPQTAILTKTG